MEDLTGISDDQRIILSTENSTENNANAEHQYEVLSIGEGLEENQQLAIELAGGNGVKYLYILNDGIPEQKITIDTGNHGDSDDVTTTDTTNETYNFDKKSVSSEADNERNCKLRLIEERSCGTMTEDHLIAQQTEVEPAPSSKETVSLSKLGKNSKGTVSYPDILVKHKPKKKLIKNENRQKVDIDTSRKIICFDEFVKDSDEICKDHEVDVMNEMKILTANKDKNATENQVGEKGDNLTEEENENTKSDLINNQPLDKNVSRCKLTSNNNTNNDSQVVKRQDIPFDNNGTLQLESIDDAICKEILESIDLSSEENEEVKIDREEIKQNKRKFVYERPTTRNMTKIKSNKNIKKENKKGKKIYQCEICSKEYFQRQTLRDHLKTHENIFYSCEMCNKVFNSQKKLNNHVKRHSREQPHLCDICGKSFRIKETLENHMYNHSDGTEKPFKCNVCGISFLKKYYLTRHETCHTGEKPFSCTECHKSFRTKGDLHRHERLHSEKLGVEPFKCKKCGKCYCSESGLLRHERAHSGEKPYSCKHCSKSFSMPGDLKIHTKTHFGGDYLPCNICGKVLTSAVGFKRHQRMHSGEKPYKCNECNNRFIDQWGLMQHQKLHLPGNQRPPPRARKINTGMTGQKFIHVFALKNEPKKTDTITITRS